MQRKLKILLCHEYYRQAGGESTVFENEVHGLQDLGHPIVVYTRQNDDIDDMNFRQRAETIPAAFFSRRTYREITQLARKENPDIAIVQNVFPLVSPSIYSALHSLSIPIIQATYNYRFICPAAELYSHGNICERCIPGNYFHGIIRRCYRHSTSASAWYASILWSHRRLGTFVKNINLFMVPDHFLGQKLTEGGIPGHKIRVNVNPFFVDQYTPSYTRQPYFLYVGRLVKQKGIVTLTNAMAFVRSSARLLIVGQGEAEPQIRAIISQNHLDERVSILGPRWKEDVKPLIANATAVVVPSEWYDDLPMIICQANAMGKPVIASRIDGIPEYVRAGENGFLFEAGNIAELAAVIDQVAAMPEKEFEQISRRSRLTAERAFDYSGHYQTLMRLAQEALHA